MLFYYGWLPSSQPGFQGTQYTERCRILNDFHGRLDQHAVKLRFMRRARGGGPPGRKADKAGKRPALRVPHAVKCHYALPPPMLPLPHEKPRLVCMVPEGLRTSDPVCSPDDQEEVTAKDCIHRCWRRRIASFAKKLKYEITTILVSNEVLCHMISVPILTYFCLP